MRLSVDFGENGIAGTRSEDGETAHTLIGVALKHKIGAKFGALELTFSQWR